MNVFRLHVALAAFAACLSMASASVAGTPGTIEAASRAVSGGRAIEVLVSQSEIKSNINPSMAEAATGGGLLGAVIANAQNSSRSKKAEAAIGPVRTALIGFDADALALDTTKQAVANTTWLQPTAITFNKDSSELGKSGFIDSSGAAQVAFVEYSYDLSPDFASIRVVANLQFANKVLPAGSAGKPESRLSPRNLAFAQTIRSVVTMPGAGKDLASNAALWSANDGKAAKAALILAFAKIRTLLPRALALSTADVKAMTAKDKPKAVVAGFSGRVQETGPSETLIWANGFVNEQTLPQTS